MNYLDAISFWNDKFPEEALAHIVDNEDEVRPHLRTILQNALNQHKELPDGYVGHIFAIYLLAQFRDEASYRLGIGFLALPEPILRDLFHDLLEQSFPQVIASGYSGNPDLLYQLIQNEKACYLSRVIGLVACSILINRKSLARAEYAKFLTKLVDELRAKNDRKLLTVIAEEVADIHLGELYDQIKALYKAGVIDEEQYSQKLFDTVMQSDYANPRKYFLIEDVFDELNGKEYNA